VHQLVEAYPQLPISWFAVGCYYYLIRKYDLARRYFNKSTTIDHHFAPGWIGFGNDFAMQDESDQAMAAYRTAARLFEGSHIPLLYIGMEYLRTNNLTLSEQVLIETQLSCPTDPLIFNELGVIAFKRQKYDVAINYFLQALEKAPKQAEAMETWEPTLFNLGHSYRKLRKYKEALSCYERALSISPHNYTIHTALGLTYHLQGEIDRAIHYYHKALSVEAKDTLTSDMLRKALQEKSEEDPALSYSSDINTKVVAHSGQVSYGKHFSEWKVSRRRIVTAATVNSYIY